MEPSELINRGIEAEMSFSAVRSSGPGGQNVNEVSTAVEMRFDIPHSEVLFDSEKSTLMCRLSSRLTSEGVLIVFSQESRSQLSNRKAATDRLLRLLANALKVSKRRIPTHRTRASVARRLDAKRARSVIKRSRNIHNFD